MNKTLMKKILTFFLLMPFCLGVLAETETNDNIQKIINAESADSQVKKLDAFFIQHFKSIRKKCESNLTTILEERAKKIMEVKDNGAGLEAHANKLIFISLSCRLHYPHQNSCHLMTKTLEHDHTV